MRVKIILKKKIKVDHTKQNLKKVLIFSRHRKKYFDIFVRGALLQKCEHFEEKKNSKKTFFVLDA